MTVRLPALGALERTWDPRVSLAVRRALATDVSGAVRLAATGVLVRRKQRSAVRGLLRALSDDKWYVRQHAAMALGELGAGEARRALERAVDDPRKAVREAARNSLRRILER